VLHTSYYVRTYKNVVGIYTSFMTQTIYTNCAVATMQHGEANYGLIPDATIVAKDGRIDWVGASADRPPEYKDWPEERLDGRLVTPALIDCHTHLVFSGNRAREFEQRLKGASYEEIARSGGGISSTVTATRSASFEQLVEESLPRLDALIRDGVAVVEIKSGYGLTIEDELRMLRVARHLDTLRPVKVVTTWLAAHSLPPDFADRADAYIDEIVIPGLSRAAEEGLVDAVDGFCESIGFSPAQIERVFKAAQSLSLPVKLHAEQLSDLKGSLLAARYSALSADHLEFLAEEDVPECLLHVEGNKAAAHGSPAPAWRGYRHRNRLQPGKLSTFVNPHRDDDVLHRVWPYSGRSAVRYDPLRRQGFGALRPVR